MPQFQPLVVPATTSNGNILHLTPVKIAGGVAFYSDFTAPTPALQAQMSVSVSQPTKTSQLYKTRIKISLPMCKSDASGNDLPVLDYITTADVTFIAPAQSNFASRSLVRGFLQKALELLGEDVVDNVMPIY